MRLQQLMILALLWVSVPASATLTGYNFNGDFDAAGGCSTRDECGPYSGMITIDDEQTGTATGTGDAYDYQYTDLMVMLDDGTELSSSTGTFSARTTPFPIQEITAFFSDSDYDFRVTWQFEVSTFDTSSITEILTALTSDTLITNSVARVIMPIDPISTDCNRSPGCGGSLSALSEKVPESSIIALLSLGLAGLGFTRRRMKA
jgi:hypothetical protein